MWSRACSADSYCVKLYDTDGSQHYGTPVYTCQPRFVSTPYTDCQYFCIELRLGQWQRQCQPRLMPLTNGACVASYETAIAKLSQNVIKRGSAALHRLSTTVREHPFQQASFVRSQSPYCAGNGSLLSASYRYQHLSMRFEKAMGAPGSQRPCAIEADMKPINYPTTCLSNDMSCNRSWLLRIVHHV